LDITDLTSGLNFEGPNANDIFTQQLLNERPIIGPFGELEGNFYKAIATGDLAAIKECVASTDVLRQQHAPNGNITRMLWNVIIHAPADLGELIISSLSTPFDYHFVDDINGRTCLHEASIEGTQRLVDLCLRNSVSINKPDLYGRTALHYAAMKGHPGVCRQLLKAHIAPNSLDRDNYSPLVYATVKGNVNCVRVLLEEGRVSAQSPTASGDLSPLSLAAQAGHVDVVDLLLKHRAAPVPNTNGEYPMHLAAQKGHVDVCQLLLTIEGWDKADKYHEWTPLLHAARHGHTACVRVLLNKGAKASHRDEFGHLGAHYAAWYGHHPSLALLLDANKDETPGRLTLLRSASLSPYVDPSLDPEIDMIPSLSLPPPIMPHRVYGHNYLVNNHLVQVSISHRSSSSSQRPSVRLHHRLISPVFKDEYLLTTSPLKLVMTTSSNVNSAPYSMTLPPQHGEGYFAFQTPSLDDLSLEFSVYPNFGTKTIGRAVALPSMFVGARNNETLSVPVLDHRLHTIGEVSGHVIIYHGMVY
jgi:CDK inhibitor PHO81